MIFKKNLVQYCGKDIPSDLAGSIPVRLGERGRRRLPSSLFAYQYKFLSIRFNFVHRFFIYLDSAFSVVYNEIKPLREVLYYV